MWRLSDVETAELVHRQPWRLPDVETARRSDCQTCILPDTVSGSGSIGGGCTAMDDLISSRDSQANINDYLDQVIAQMIQYLIENNMEPLPLEDQYVFDLEIKDLLGIKWKTRLGIFDGHAHNLTSLHRLNNATMSYTSATRTLEIQAEVEFTKIGVDYHFAAQLMNIGPSGIFDAVVNNLVADMVISVNLRDFTAELKDFRLKRAKSIKVDIKGLGLIKNWIAEAFINTFTTLFKNVILKVIEGKVRDVAAESVSHVNTERFLGSLEFN